MKQTIRLPVNLPNGGGVVYATFDTDLAPDVLAMLTNVGMRLSNKYKSHKGQVVLRQHRSLAVARIITGVYKVKEDLCVSQIDGDPLNLRRENLRVLTREEHRLLTGKTSGRKSSRPNKTGYKGVEKMSNGMFRVRIRENGKWRVIGNFIGRDNAARAYDKTVVERFGEEGFVKLNFPEEHIKGKEGQSEQA